jgi:alkylhydroperoxidase family enzyme
VIEQFFEGPAGCGKTYCLVRAAVEACKTRLADERTKLLVLTFMNGARRRRSLPLAPPPDGLSEFSRTCLDAARLMERPDVAGWVAASYPVVVLDEAQDLDPARLRLMQALCCSSCMFAAADEFQNLGASDAINEVMSWLRSSPGAQQLSVVRRTNKQGLLNVAIALRSPRAPPHRPARHAPRADFTRLVSRDPLGTPTHCGRKRHRGTPDPPYNPHRVRGAEPTRLRPTRFISTVRARVHA